MGKACYWPFKQELLQGMPCCDLWVAVLLPSASVCVAGCVGSAQRGELLLAAPLTGGWLHLGRCLSSADVNVVFLTRRSLDPASGTPGMSNELLHLRLM